MRIVLLAHWESWFTGEPLASVSPFVPFGANTDSEGYTVYLQAGLSDS